MQAAWRCRQQAAGSRQQAAGSRQQAAGSRQQAAGSRQQGGLPGRASAPPTPSPTPKPPRPPHTPGARPVELSRVMLPSHPIPPPLPHPAPARRTCSFLSGCPLPWVRLMPSTIISTYAMSCGAAAGPGGEARAERGWLSTLRTATPPCTACRPWLDGALRPAGPSAPAWVPSASAPAHGLAQAREAPAPAGARAERGWLGAAPMAPPGPPPAATPGPRRPPRGLPATPRGGPSHGSAQSRRPRPAQNRAPEGSPRGLPAVAWAEPRGRRAPGPRHGSHAPCLRPQAPGPWLGPRALRPPPRALAQAREAPAPPRPPLRTPPAGAALVGAAAGWRARCRMPRPHRAPRAGPGTPPWPCRGLRPGHGG